MPTPIESINLNLFPPRLRSCINNVFEDASSITGKFAGSIAICNVDSGRGYCENESVVYMDRISLKISYAGHYFCCTIMFNEEDEEFAPDFDFEDTTFLHDPDRKSIEQNVPSWAKWDVNNNCSLTNILREFYQNYNKHQVERLQKDSNSRFAFEYSSLTGQMNYSPDDIQVLIKDDVVIFLIYIKVISMELPVFENINLNPGSEAAFLLVTFHSESQIETKLYLTPRIERVLGNSSNLQIPQFLSEGGCLMDYVPTVSKWLSDKIENISNCYQRSREFVTTILNHYGTSIIEYDDLYCNKIVMLLETEGIYFLLTILLGKNFPAEKPRFIYQSIQHLSYGQTLSETVMDYPYSPRWKPIQMIKKALEKILENIGAFHKNATIKSTS